jgi:hypothetical protein
MPTQSPLIGDLRTTPLPELFRAIYRDGSSGILDLQHDKDQRRVFFVGGEVRSAVSNELGQKVGQHLKAAGLVVEVDIEEALQKKSEGIRLGNALVAIGALDAETLEKELRKLVAEIIFSAFSWESGFFRFALSDAPVPADVMLSISTADVILEAIRRMPSDDGVRLCIGDFSRRLSIAEDPFLRLQRVTLAPDEGFLISRIDGIHTIEQLTKSVPMPIPRLLRLVYGLIATGIVELVPETGKSMAGRTAAVPIPGSPKPPAPPPAQPSAATTAAPAKMPQGIAPRGLNVQIAATRRTTAIMAPKKPTAPIFQKEEIDFRRRKILTTYQKLRSMTAHDILEIPLNPTFRELRQKYNDLAEIYHPDIAFRPEYADLKREMTEIFRKLEQSYRMLAVRFGDQFSEG